MFTRRRFVHNAAVFTGAIASGTLTGCLSVSSGAGRKASDIRIEHVSHGYEEYVFRAPVGFAGAVVKRATLVTVRCSVRTRAGEATTGFGSMPFNHTFSFPSKTLPDDTKNEAMKALAAELTKVTGSYTEFGHPLEINWHLAPLYER